ncbi:MAG: tetratricopeptide repeat protein [Bacteroidetes bacterium]|jgi:CHAT domain-containing protein/Tfp pilus assembly protein PilF|nr:tetratricopeptide repeat protein [Bacteroidota bacterium]
MKKIFLFIFLVATIGSRAQDTTLDSLKLLLKNAGHDSTRVAVLVAFGETIYAQDPDTAIVLWKQANNLAEQNLKNYAASSPEYLNLSRYLANSLNNIGYVYHNQGDIPKTIEYWNKSLKAREQMNDKTGIATSYNNFGVMYLLQGDVAKGIDYFQKSLKLQEELGNKDGIANSLNNMGVIYDDQGDPQKALEYYQRSLLMNEEVNNKKNMAIALNNIAYVLQGRGDLSRALEYMFKSLKINEEINDKYGLGVCFNNIGSLYGDQGDIPRSMEYQQKSLETFEAIDHKKGMVTSLRNIGNGYDLQGNSAKAMDYFQNSLKVAEEINDKQEIASALYYIAGIYMEQGDLSKALDYFERSLKMNEEINYKKNISLSLISIAAVYRKQKEHSKAIEYLDRSLKLSRELNFPMNIKNTSRNLCINHLALASSDSAYVYASLLKKTASQQLDKNYYSLSENEKEKYFATMEKDFALYFDFAAGFHKKFPNLTDTAYNIALTNKGLSLKSSTAMRTAILSSKDPLLIAQYENWIFLKKKIAKLYESGKDTKELDNKANELEKELVKQSTAFSDFDKVKKLNWKQVQQGLKTGEAAIEFVHFKSELDTLHPVKYAALLIRQQSVHPEMISLCTEADLQKILGTFQGNNAGFVNKTYGTKTEAQTALYEKIWQPMEPYLKDVTTVYYSPSGLLHKISFSAISHKKNSFLCDTYNLNRQGSTGKIVLPDNANYSHTDEVMLIGGINYNTDSTPKEIWSYLPGTLSEVEQIEKLLEIKKTKTDYFVAVNANEENVKKVVSRVQLLHIATHGFFFPDPEQVRGEQKSKTDQPENLTFRGTTHYADWSFVNNKNPLMRSGLVLAAANDVWERDPLAEGEDGILTAQEVANLDMRKTKLVVLSACETGLGDIKGSEGVYGLQRAFKMAGVKNIIMSLWQVPDKETSEFMIGFYQNLTAVKDIKKAFNTTQKEMRKKYDPYYWAAFVLVE